jgi:hypothetical protein
VSEKPAGSKREQTKQPSRYAAIIKNLFARHYKQGQRSFAFTRDEFEKIAAELKIVLPKNVGDLIYSFRFRNALPEEILATASKGMEWSIELAGRAQYRFTLGRINRIVPRQELIVIKIPDSTPEIIAAYAMTDEQALLAKVRYNRLIDVFLGLTTYSLQNHLRTTVKNMGQIEVDEVYVGVNRNGPQFVIPVQAKGGADQLGTTQTKQDLACCEEKFPKLTCRPVSAQFMDDNVIALFELAMHGGEVKVVEERHYKLVPADRIGDDDLRLYAGR